MYYNNPILTKIIGATNSPQKLVTTPPGDGEEILFKDSAGLKSGKYSKGNIMDLIKAAKAFGVDPLEAIGIAIQEEGFKKPNESSKGRRGRGGIGNVTNLKFSDKENSMLNQYYDKGYDLDSIRLAYAVKLKNDYAKQLGFNDDAARLQAYNGYGKLTPALFGGATKAYGVDITNGVDLKKNPLYGKRILALKKDLMSNKDIAALLTQ